MTLPLPDVSLGAAAISTIVVKDSADAVDVDLTNDAGSVNSLGTLKIGNNVTVNIAPAQLAGIDSILPSDVEPAEGVSRGAINIAGTITQNIDLTPLEVNLDLSSQAGFAVQDDGSVKIGDFTVTLPVLVSGQTLTLAASQLAGFLALDGSGTLRINGDFPDDGATYDLTDVAATLSFDDGDGGLISVGQGSTLILTAAQAVAQETATGAGTVNRHR